VKLRALSAPDSAVPRGKQQKMPVQALFRPNPAVQVVDFIGSDAKFRYAAEQRNFFGLTAELNGPNSGIAAEFMGSGFSWRSTISAAGHC
jgi:hypothetical protein